MTDILDPSENELAAPSIDRDLSTSEASGEGNEPGAGAASKLDLLLPPRPLIIEAFTGELLDPDDLGRLREHLKAVEKFLDEHNKKVASVYETRRRLRARIGELVPTDLPRRRDMSKAQALVARCPRCSTRIPVSHIEEDE